jgi:hypothetical protein
MRKQATNTGIKHDTGKLPMGLIPVSAKRGLAAVLAHGAKKYAPHNWRKGMAWSRLIDSAYRHLDAFCEGKDVDDEPDSEGRPGSMQLHVDCLQACVAFLSTYQHEGLGIDDRFKAPKPQKGKKKS